MTQRVESLAELNDGHAIWEMLREINPEYFHGELPSQKRSDYSRQQNLQSVHAQISAYLDEQRVTYEPVTEDDLKKLAGDGASSSVTNVRFPWSSANATGADGVVQLLKLVLLLAISPPNAQVIEKIQRLPIPVPQVMMGLIQEVAPSQSQSDDDDDDLSDRESVLGNHRRSDPSSPSRKLDRELALEERIASLRLQLDRKDADLRDDQAQKEEISAAYYRLQEGHDAMTVLLADREHQVKKLQSVNSEKEQSSLRDLEITISQQEEVISHHEAQITEHQSKEAELERKISKLSKADKEKQDLQDLLDEQKVKLEEQTRKANSGENYKRKLQASQGIERERDALRQQFDEARPRLQEYDQIRRANAKLLQENSEMSQTLSRSERDNTELRDTKQAYLAEIDRLHKESSAYREIYAQGQERIADLEGGSSGSEIHSSPTVVDGGLESELADTFKNEEQRQVTLTSLVSTQGLMHDSKIRILDLEKQLKQSTDNASERDTKIITLLRQLELAQDALAEQNQKHQETRQEMSALQSSLAEVRQGHPIEGYVAPNLDPDCIAYDFKNSTETFRKMREQLKTEQSLREELEAKLSIMRKDLVTANNDRTFSFEHHCLMTDLSIDLFEAGLLDHPKFQEVEEGKKQPSTADPDAKMKMESESHEELKDIIQQAAASLSAETTKDRNEFFHRNVDAFAAKIEEGRERTAKAQQVHEKLFSSDTTSQSAPPLHPDRVSAFLGKLLGLGKR